MASLIDYSDLTLNEQEALNVSEAVFEKAYAAPELARAHYVATGIQMKTQIPFFGLLGGPLAKAANGCTPNEPSNVVNLTEKYWDPALCEFRMGHCQADVRQLYKMWKRSQEALGTWEKMEVPQMNFIQDAILKSLKEEIFRISQFADKSAANVSGGGYITNGVSTTYFTMINGLWQQIFAATISDKYTIPENAAATKVLQLQLASDRALNVFRELYSNADPRIFTAPDLTFQITRSLWNNWNNFLEDKSLVFSLDRTENGSTKASYRGIPIVIRDDWDRNVVSYNDLSTTYLYPHRAILSPTSNVPLGTSDEMSLNNLESFYDKKDKKWYFDVAFYLDAKLLSEYMTGVAY